MNLVSSAGATIGQLTDAESLLTSLHEVIDSDLDWDIRRRVVETLVKDILITTVGEGRKKQAEVEVIYSFDSPAEVVEHDTPQHIRNPGCYRLP